MSEERTYECWAVVDKTRVLAVANSREAAIHDYRKSTFDGQKSWEHLMEVRGVRVTRMECNPVEYFDRWSPDGKWRPAE